MRDENNDDADALLVQIASDWAHVSALFRWEIQSVLLGSELASRIDSDDVDAALEALRDLPTCLGLSALGKSPTGRGSG